MSEVLAVRELRRKWKHQKERLHQVDPEHPYNARFTAHAAGFEERNSNGETVLALLSRWTASNSLYGRRDKMAVSRCEIPLV